MNAPAAQDAINLKTLADSDSDSEDDVPLAGRIQKNGKAIA